jgi:hypothetical protein
VRRGRFDVYVPRQLGRIVNVGNALPRRVREGLTRVMGAERAMLEIDESQRAAYRERIGERPQTPDE